MLTTLLMAGLLLGWSGIETPSSSPPAQEEERDLFRGPTIFRKLELGGAFPPLDLHALSQEPTRLLPKGERPKVVAFLRPDQMDSRRLLSDFATLVLDAEGPKPEVIVIGMPGRGAVGWGELTKALPKLVTVYLGDSKTREALGIIALPSVAIIGADGLLYRTHVLYDRELVGRIRLQYEALLSGKSDELDEAARVRQRHENLALNAAALETAGQLRDALSLRLQQLALELEPARVHQDLGRTYLLLGNARTAIRHLEKSLELKETISVRTLLGSALLRVGRFDEAERELLKVLPLTPRKARTHRDLAEIYERRGDLDRALVHIKAAIAALRPAPKEGSDEDR